tara:strand:- start:1154 stop:1621 length:468 start_codon:yes stop_codon:yes gene_type:complete
MGVISGFASSIPIVYKEGDGFEMSRTVDEAITEDFKCLLLSAGKIYDETFGCDLKKFLFENVEQVDYGEITSIINDQARRYLGSYLSVLSIKYVTNKEDPNVDRNALVIQISAQSKITGAPLPVSVTLDPVRGKLRAQSGNTFHGNPNNYNLTDR